MRRNKKICKSFLLGVLLFKQTNQADIPNPLHYLSIILLLLDILLAEYKLLLTGKFQTPVIETEISLIKLKLVEYI